MTLRLNNDNGNSASIDYVDGVTTDSTITIPEGNGTLVTDDFTGDVEIDGTVQIGGDPDGGAENGVLLVDGGRIDVSRTDAAQPIYRGFTTGTAAATSQINADGSSEFTGQSRFWMSAENLVPLSCYRPTTGSGNNLAQFRSDIGGASTVKVTINAGGNVVSNGTTLTSDQRLKTAIVDADPQWDDIKALKLRNYEWLAEPGVEKLGLVAQEVEATSPGLIYTQIFTDEETGEVESETKGIKFDPLVYKMLGALQQAMTRIETLEAEVQALKGGN